MLFMMLRIYISANAIRSPILFILSKKLPLLKLFFITLHFPPKIANSISYRSVANAPDLCLTLRGSLT